MKKIIVFFVFLFISFFLRTVPVGAENFQELFQQGQEFYDQGNYQKAVEAFEKVVELDQNFAPAYNALGLAHLGLKDPVADVAWFFKVAVDIDPKYADAYSNLCRTYYQSDMFDEAEQACQDALAINPELPQAQLSLAWVYLRGPKKANEALHYFEKVEKKISSPMIDFGKGLAYSMLRDNARVLEMVTMLRLQGANDLASQLESDIRRTEEVPLPPVPITAPVQSSSTSTIVGRQPAGNLNPSPENETALAPGQMRIRLKGSMQNSPSSGKSSTTSKSHPGSLSD
jgi:lipopolysaccharide biosynthesis regulator YciM